MRVLNPKKLIISGLLFLLSNFTVSTIEDDYKLQASEPRPYVQRASSIKDDVNVYGPEILTFHKEDVFRYFGTLKDNLFVYRVFQSLHYMRNFRHKTIQSEFSPVIITQNSKEVPSKGACVDLGGYIASFAQSDTSFASCVTFNTLVQDASYIEQHPLLDVNQSSFLIKPRLKDLYVISFPFKNITSSWASLYLGSCALHACILVYLAKQKHLLQPDLSSLYIGWGKTGSNITHGVLSAVMLACAIAPLKKIVIQVPDDEAHRMASMAYKQLLTLRGKTIQESIQTFSSFT